MTKLFPSKCSRVPGLSSTIGGNTLVISTCLVIETSVLILPLYPKGELMIRTLSESKSR